MGEQPAKDQAQGSADGPLVWGGMTPCSKTAPRDQLNGAAPQTIQGFTRTSMRYSSGRGRRGEQRLRGWEN